MSCVTSPRTGASAQFDAGEGPLPAPQDEQRAGQQTVGRHGRVTVDDAFVSAHTVGYERLEGLVKQYSPDLVSSLCDVPAADISAASPINAMRFILTPLPRASLCDNISVLQLVNPD